jgi:hypothetical protein
MLSLGWSNWAFRLRDSIGRRHRCTRCCGIQIHKDADILIAEASKRLPRAAITASANSAATPSLIAAATLSEVVKPVPFNASLSVAEAVSTVDMLGLIN